MFRLLERRETLARLSQLLEQAQAGPGQVAFVSGEAGIGKSALLRVFTQSASTASSTTAAPPLWGACDPLHTPQPLRPAA